MIGEGLVGQDVESPRVRIGLQLLVPTGGVELVEPRAEAGQLTFRKLTDFLFDLFDLGRGAASGLLGDSIAPLKVWPSSNHSQTSSASTAATSRGDSGSFSRIATSGGRIDDHRSNRKAVFVVAEDLIRRPVVQYR